MKTPEHAEMIEGPEAFERFREAAKKMLAAPKVANPFGKRKTKNKRTKDSNGTK
jgi:hypothetical protein